MTLGLVLSPVSGAVSESYATEVSVEKSNKEKAIEKIGTIKNYLKYYESFKGSTDYRLADDTSRAKIDKVVKDAGDYSDKHEVSLVELDKHISNIENALAELASNAEANQKNLKNNILLARKLLAKNDTKKDLDEYKQVDEKIANAMEVLKKDNIDKTEFKNLNTANSELDDAFLKAREKFEDNTSYELPNDEEISKLDEELNDEKVNIDGEDQNLDAKEIENEIRILKSYINDKGNINKIFSNADFKDEDLKKSYNETFKKALNVVLGEEKLKDLKEYQDLSAKLKKLTEEIKKSKGETKEEEKPVPKEENKKLDKLKASIEKGNKFFLSDAYNKANEEKKSKFLRALVDAENLRDDYKRDPSSVKDEEIEKATKALDEALASFDKFSDKDKARDAIKGLLGLTKGIKIEQIYDTRDTKEAKDAYTKAREKAAKLADDKKASLEDLDKAYKDFNESVVKLAEFLTSRLQKLVDDDKTFRESDKYKDSEKDSKKEEAIKNYKKLVEDGEKELKKAAPDANILNVIYKKLADARAEINGDMTSQARKLSDAIYDSYLFLESEDYKKAAVSTNENIKDAAKNYKELVEAAKTLKEAGKLDSQEAKDLLDSINNAKDFMDGNISKEKYLSNKYYYILKAVREYKNKEEYNKLPQALRKKLDDALELYETSSDEKAVFSALDAVWQEKEIQAIIKKMEWEKNPNKTRDKLLEDLTALIGEDKKLKEGGFKYQKAQKALRDAYDQALKEATDFIKNNDKPTEEQVRAVYNKLLNAKNALDGDKFDQLIHDLAARFKKDQMKIANPADRKAIADKINGLSGENMTMDDALRVEKELNDLINPKFAATQTLVPQGQAPTTSRPISTVTNPGSIVKTGINGIAKVAVVLVAALGIFKLTSKKGDKNENN